MQQLKGNAQPQINVTPLIDVLLVLLIIFMVISPMRPSRFVAQVPEKPAPEIEPMIDHCDLCLLVTVNADGSYALNSQAAPTLNDLNDWLHRALDGRPADRKTVFLKAPQNIAYGRVAQVIDVMKSAGSAPIGLQVDDLN
jgi:biopolymer transport protein ExbD